MLLHRTSIFVDDVFLQRKIGSAQFCNSLSGTTWCRSALEAYVS